MPAKILVRMLLAVLGISILGGAIGALLTGFLRPASGILSPFWMLSCAMLILAIAYAASFFFNGRSQSK